MEGQDLRQSSEYSKYMKNIGWQVESGIFIKKFPLIPWSFIKVQRPNWPIDLKKVEKIRKKYKAIQIKIEPNVIDKKKWKEIESELEKYGYKKDKSPMLPTKTIWLDLRKNEHQLLKEMHYKTRYNIKKSQITNNKLQTHPPPRGHGASEGTANRKLQTIRGDEITDEELKEFYEVYKKNAKKQRFWGLKFNQLKWLMKCFGKKSYLLVSRQKLKNKELLGGLILLIHDKTAYYSHNAATKEGKKLFMPTLLVWEAIKLAKKLKCKRFDFEGISDCRFPVTKKWQGFSRFKKGFGGKEVEYIGSFIYT